MYIRLIPFLLLMFAPFLGTGQEFNYVHYDTKDGLAGSTVYDVCQDLDGFMWFATENGLSRYDGTNFKNFTVKDGLPDNEVLKLFPDSKGRVWIGCFSKEVCYYYKGAIYNKENTKSLADEKLKISGLNFSEDNDGNMLISDFGRLMKISADGKIDELTDQVEFKIHKFKLIGAVTNYLDGGFILWGNDSVFKFKSKIVFFYSTKFSRPDKYFPSIVHPNNKVHFAKVPDEPLGYTNHRQSIIYVNTVNGAWAFDSINNFLSDHFLEGKKVSKTIDDTEKNIWFSTLGDGVYKLPSKEMRTIHFPAAEGTANHAVFSLTSYRDLILAGLGFSKAALINAAKVNRMLDYGEQTKLSSNQLSTNRLYCSKTLSNGIVMLGYDAYLAKMQNDKTSFSNIVAVKSIDQIDDNFVVVATYATALKVRISDLTVMDTLWKGRCTEVFYHQGNYYIGTMTGLYQVRADKSFKFLGDIHPALKRKVADIKADAEGRLYVATNDNGVLILKDGKVVHALNDGNGLSSNICKTLFIHENYVWVGTNKGLNKFQIGNPLQVLKYGSADGLPSDIINALYVEDSTVWVGSPAGLTFFNENKVSTVSACRLVLLNTIYSGEQRSKNNYRLSYKNNHISFDYVAISYKSAGDIIYHYKLSGLDTSWNETRETSLIYRSLPPGNYQLNLYAINKFGVKSDILDIKFSISTPYWKTWWFYLTILLFTAGITAWIVTWRIGIIRKRIEEKNNVQKQFAVLEQQALQAQMNPHFIFNCLNSIQQYILINDREKASQYLTGFASLIRQTLDISSRPSISIEEEVAYLKKYLSMEKMRFGDNFSFKISVGKTVRESGKELPSLLLQPYVENALRHGIRYKKDGNGKVEIIFSAEGENICCRIIDNGIGRQKAIAYKTKEHIEYQSKGMDMTSKRIKLINAINGTKIKVEILDLVGVSGEAAGTEVIVQIPIS